MIARLPTNANKNKRKRTSDYIPESNLKKYANANHFGFNLNKNDCDLTQPRLKRPKLSFDAMMKSPIKMRKSADLERLSLDNCIDWSLHKLIVCARYSLNPELECLCGANIPSKGLSHSILQKIKQKMLGNALVFNSQIGSLVNRNAQIQSFLESILLLHAGKCSLSIEYLSNLQTVCHQIKIQSMGSSHCILFVFVAEKVNFLLSRLLVKLEEIDFDFCSNGIEMKSFFGIITDGHAKWQIVRRRNEQRFVAKDVFSDPLLARNKNFDLVQILKHLPNKNGESEVDSEKLSKFKQTTASLARERWQLFKNRFCDNLHQKALYDGLVLDCNMNENMSNLKQMSQIIHGLIDEQKHSFSKAFKIALRHNSDLNRPAINPFHELNIKQQRKKWNEYEALSEQVYNERSAYQQSLTQIQNEWLRD